MEIIFECFSLVDTLAEVYDFVRNTLKIRGLTDVQTWDTEDDGILLLLTIRRIFQTVSIISENVVKRLAETDFYKALLDDLHCVKRQDLIHLEKLDLVS